MTVMEVVKGKYISMNIGCLFFYQDMFFPVDIIGFLIIGAVMNAAGFLTFACRSHNKSGND